MSATRASRSVSILDDMAGIARRSIARRAGQAWPSTAWQSDPVGFARVILGVSLWAFQVEFLEAIRDHRHVSVSGGRKIGKDFAVAVACLWFYCSFPDARVILLAPTSKQLDEIVYLEIRKLLARSGRCLDCKTADPDGPTPCPHSAVIGGKVGLQAHTGIRAEDFRQIIGLTAVSEGGLRGLSGARILAIEDEASDIKDEFDTALVGNLAGAQCTRVMISNPTRTEGFFYRSHHEERDLFHRMQVSTETNPNVVKGENIFPGLGDRQWIRERELAWGRGSPNWLANVEGQFVRAEEGQLFTIEAVAAAEARWATASADGRLCIGIDVAGEEHGGDETVFVPRRAQRVLELHVGGSEGARGMTPEAILSDLRYLLGKYRTTDDCEDRIPIVVVDRDGHIGARVYDTIQAYRLRDERNSNEFQLIGFQGSKTPLGRMSDSYRLNRDALFGGLVEAVRDGLGIPIDTKLEGELVSLRWIDAERGKSKLIHKTDLRAKLGRSPDRLDALALSTWGERRLAPVIDLPTHVERVDHRQGAYERRAETRFDPYSYRTYRGR